MKTVIFSIIFCVFSHIGFSQIDVKGIVIDRANQRATEGVNKGLDAGEEGVRNAGKKKDKPDKEEKSKSENGDSESSSKSESKSGSAGGEDKSGYNYKTSDYTAAPLKSYSNYDFVPGEKILFEDDYKEAQDGEFPPRWNLYGGQGAVNTSGSDKYYICTEGATGNPNKLEPAMKVSKYLGSTFTIEFDFMFSGEDETIAILFKDNEGDEARHLLLNYDGNISAAYFANDLVGMYKGAIQHFFNKWHHVAVAYKNHQMKVYLDADRQLVIPNTGFDPVSMMMGLAEKARFKNFKLAEGGGMNMLGKILTDGKIVTHAIKFDVNKSTIKPESMGFLNELAKWMKENPTVKLEVDGHTDSDGDEASNMKLSQARAESVKAQLVSQGVQSSRLTTKGFGESKPMDNNSGPEGKANNRRVEFIKI